MAVSDRAPRASELHNLFRRLANIDQEYLVYADGFRTRSFRYTEIARLAESFAARLRESGIQKGERIMIWSESRPGWIVALWGSLLEGVVIVPVEPHSSVELFRRIEEKVQPRSILVGDRVPALDTPVWRMADIERDEKHVQFEPAPVYEDDIAEIVFTSGATGEPKGVVITHGNLAAQIRPIDDRIAPYRKYVGPFAPLRILNLLPMSHLFGQSLAAFIPPLIPASVVFISTTTPREIATQIRSRHIAVLVAVPKVLDVLRDFVTRRFPKAADTAHHADKPLRRWWRYRRVHWMFGWKFCCLISGGAPLSAELEQFWSNLAFVVVQGYGLTETAPVVSFTNPFRAQPGTTGKPLKGVELKIAPDGEVLVRGENVTPGYFESSQENASVFEDGWFHTGDFGELDSAGNLKIRGRKKEIIVTPEGLKVFPSDVEAVLDRLPGVRESAVIGKDRVHAVLVLDPDVNAEEIVRQANAKLEDHQRIRSFSIWTGSELPRTPTTGKLRRNEIAAAIAGGATESPSSQETDLAGLIQKYAPGRTIGPDTTFDELGLSSLDRVELMMDLEERLATPVDERAFASARTLSDLAKPAPSAEAVPFPRYSRNPIVKLIRSASLEGFLLPLTRLVARPKVRGIENLNSLHGPVIFAANHESHLDAPVIFASLPRRLRHKIAPVVAREAFHAHFHPKGHSLRERWIDSGLYRLATVLFNVFTIPQTEAGTLESIRYMGELIDQGSSILIFPEGRRSETPEIAPFRPGIGMMASRLGVPVVAVRLVNLGRLLPVGSARLHWVPVEVRFGAPMEMKDESYSNFAARLHDAVRAL